MTPRILCLSTAAALLLTGCGDSGLNPFNWFRSDPQAETVADADVRVVTDTRPLVDQITTLVVERTPGGAIIRATALPPAQGWYDASLVSLNPDDKAENGVLAFDFRAYPPEAPTRVSTAQSRELTAAVFVSDIVLAGVRQIRVNGARNTRTARR